MATVHFISLGRKPSHILVVLKMVLDMVVELNSIFKETKFIKGHFEMTSGKVVEKNLMSKETKYIVVNGPIICVMGLVLHTFQREVNISAVMKIIL